MACRKYQREGRKVHEKCGFSLDGNMELAREFSISYRKSICPLNAFEDYGSLECDNLYFGR